MNIHPTGTGPHRHVNICNINEQFLVDLFDQLWDQYRQRVPYAGQYEQLIAQSGDTFCNDHIAFRCYACQQPCIGMTLLARIFETLGYSVAGNSRSTTNISMQCTCNTQMQRCLSYLSQN